jgi:hypothetical protein
MLARSEPGVGKRGSGNRSLRHIHLVLRESGECRRGDAEVLCKYVRRRVRDPVADREGSELREIAVVKDEQEQAIVQSLDRMTVAAREIPDVAWTEIDDLRPIVGIDDGGPAMSVENVAPLGGIGVPV